MIDESKIMPYNFFKYGGVYSGEHLGMRYLIKRVEIEEGEDKIKKFLAVVWQGPYASSAVSDEDKTQEYFDFSEEGRKEAVNWLKMQYETRKELWDNAPSILNVAPIVHE